MHKTGAAEDIVIYRTADLNIGYCKACDYCEKNNGECIIEDDMQKVLLSLTECDTLVVITPVYFSAMPASLKAIVDRCQCLYAYPKQYAPKKAYILAFGGSSLYDGQFEGIFASFKHVFKDINATLTDSLCIPDTDSFMNETDDIIREEIADFSKNIYNNRQ